MKQIILAILIVAGLYSCQKKDDTTPAPSQVEIAISSPANGQAVRSGDTVRINATVTYISELHGYEVQIIDTATDSVLYDDDQHVHNDHFTISDTWVATGTQAMGLKLKIVAEIDHNGNEAEKSVLFTYQP